MRTKPSPGTPCIGKHGGQLTATGMGSLRCLLRGLSKVQLPGNSVPRRHLTNLAFSPIASSCTRHQPTWLRGAAATSTGCYQTTLFATHGWIAAHRASTTSTAATLADEVIPSLGMSGTTAAEKPESSSGSQWQEPEFKFPGGSPKKGSYRWADLPLWAQGVIALAAALAAALGMSLFLDLEQEAGGTDQSLTEVPTEGLKAQLLELLTQCEVMLMKVVSSSLIAKILLVLLAGVPFILIFGTIYHKITGTPLKRSLLRCYALINRLPGCGSVIGEESFAAALLINFIYFLGLFTFVTFIGFVTQDVREVYSQVQGGLYPVQKVGHTVLLNWNEHTPLVLENLARGKFAAPDNPFFARPVAILANRPKAEMDAALKDIPLEVHTRQGSPLVWRDLKMVAADKAATILIMQPASPSVASPQAQVAAAAMAVAALTLEKGRAQQRVLLQSPVLGLSSFATEASASGSPCLMSAASICGSAMAAKGCQVQTVKLEKVDFAHKFATIAALQPGIVEVYKSILTPGGATLAVQPVPPSLVGSTYQRARRSFDKAIVCGYMRDGAVQMLPAEDEVLLAGDCLITLSLHFRPAPLFDDAEAFFKQYCDCSGVALYQRIQPLKIIILLMGSKNHQAVSNFTHDLDQFAPRGSSIVFVTPKGGCSDLEPLEAGGTSRRCSFSLMESSDDSPVTSQVLAAAGIKDADTVLMAGMHHLSDTEADALVMASLMQVQEAVHHSGRKDAPHFVARVRKPSTELAVRNFLRAYKKALPSDQAARAITQPDLIETDHLVASILAQSASSQDYLPVVTHLLNNSNGAEIYLRDPTCYCRCLIDNEASFAEIAERARAHNETAVGYRTAEGVDVLCPEPSQVIRLSATDRLVVFADEFCVTSHHEPEMPDHASIF